MTNKKAQTVDRRLKNFDEVTSRLQKKIVVEAARRIPMVTDPTHSVHSPLGVDIPEFVRILREGDVPGAYQKLLEQNNLPGVWSRIGENPLSDQNISLDYKLLERFVCDHSSKKLFRRKVTLRNGKKVAVIGAGPTGLMAAAELAKLDYQVTLFEAFAKPGGRLQYGVANFRLPEEVLKSDINYIMSLGVAIQTNTIFGQTLHLEDLKKEGFEAVLLCVGDGPSDPLKLKGVHLGGVYFAEEILTQANSINPSALKHNSSLKIGKRVVVVGSSDQALDCARTFRRLSCDVSLVFEETEEDLKVDETELEYAKEEGVRLIGLTNPIEILDDDDGFVSGLKFNHYDYCDPEKTGNWTLVPVPDSEGLIELDTLILSTHATHNQMICNLFPDLTCYAQGAISVDNETGLTSIDKVFAAGHAVEVNGDLKTAMIAGKAVAEKIDKVLKA